MTDVVPAKVVAMADEMIPPASEKIIIGRVIMPVVGDTSVLEPVVVDSGLKIGSVLVISREEIPVRILNLEDKEIAIPKNTHLGKLVNVECEVESVLHTSEDNDNSTDADIVPEHLQELFNISRKGLDPQQEQMLAKVHSQRMTMTWAVLNMSLTRLALGMQHPYDNQLGKHL